jgi:hypothetical protein
MISAVLWQHVCQVVVCTPRSTHTTTQSPARLPARHMCTPCSEECVPFGLETRHKTHSVRYTHLSTVVSDITDLQEL